MAFVLLLCLVLVQVGRSQEIWMGVNASWQFSKRFSLEGEQEFRLADKYYFYKKILTEGGLSFELTRFVELESVYRFTNTPEDNYHRITGQVSLEQDLGQSDWEVQYRLRGQREYPGKGAEDPLETLVRNKLTLVFKDFKDVDPFVSGELFYQLDDLDLFNRYRLTTGVDIDLHALWTLTVFYRFEHNYNREFPNNDYIIGASLGFDLPKSSKNENLENL